MRLSPLGATCARMERGGAGLTRRRGWVIHTQLEPLFVNCARRRDKQFSGFHLETRHPPGWASQDNPGYPGIENVDWDNPGPGPKISRDKMSRLAYLGIGQLFVKCWEKTSLHSPSHRECHFRMPPARRRSPGHLSQTHAHLQQRGTVAPSAKWGCIFLSYSFALQIQVFDNFFSE